MFNSYNCSLAEKYNFLNQITSVKERLHTWGHRDLTLAGRILIFKSMALSNTVYKSTMVSPRKQFIDLLSSIKQNFIWNGHRPKIKHSTLVGEYAEGGYKDVDIQSQLESLKIMWIRRFLEDNFHAWKSIPNALFLDLGVNAVFHDNFKPSTYCMQKIQSYPLFYQQLIGFWGKGSRKEPLNALEIVNQVIWNNSFLLKQGSSLFYPSLYNKGILKVNDLLDDFGHFMKWTSAKLKSDVKEQDAMLWLSVLESTPSQWKKKVKSHDMKIADDMSDGPSLNMTVKSVYNILLRSVKTCPTFQKSIKTLLSCYSINWPEVYMISHKVIIESSLRVFQYKLLNNIII